MKIKKVDDKPVVIHTKMTKRSRKIKFFLSYIKSWMRMEKNIQHLKHLLRRKKQINGKKKLSTSSLSENLRFKSVQH